MKTLYTAKATATGSGRGGHVRSSDEALITDLSVPRELGGPGGDGTNPEQLFAAGYAACFHSALQLVARKQRMKLEGSSVTAAVGLVPSGPGYGLTVQLTVEVPGVEPDAAQALAAAAHQVCPYSNATRGNVEVAVAVAA
ncbi:MAG: organic hydroperoxide resistance protein [Micromonosporaceae bacterium]